MMVVHGKFEWDSNKNEINIKKHGLSFDAIIEVFNDPYFIEKIDIEHSTLEEERLIGIGSLNGFVIITIVYTERDRTRLISSRLATKKEEAFYYEQRKNKKNIKPDTSRFEPICSNYSSDTLVCSWRTLLFSA